MPIKEKKIVLPKKNSLEYTVFLYILKNDFRSSITISLEINRIKNTRYYYKTIQKTIYKLRKQKLVQCYAQRWKVTDRVKIICQLMLKKQ